MDSKVSWMIAAEPGWKALYGIDDDEVGRSRIVGWAGVERNGGIVLVGVVVDPNDPTQLVPADDVVDPSGGELMRYGFAG
jgi:hypothetical protein